MNAVPTIARKNNQDSSKKYSTFYVSNQLYGIDVIQVQEIAKPLPITKIHLAPAHVLGLINLRGQIATAIGLRELFGLAQNTESEKMSVVYKCDGAPLSLLVDQIGDVIEVTGETFEKPPETLNASIKRFMSGVYKTPEAILSVLDIEKLNAFLFK
jgi:purine-binding chemotaxis protein CheW